MWPDRVSNPGPLTYESGALPTALRGPARYVVSSLIVHSQKEVYTTDTRTVIPMFAPASAGETKMEIMQTPITQFFRTCVKNAYTLNLQNKE